MRIARFIAAHLSTSAGDSRKSSPGIAVAIAGVAVALAVMMLTLAIVTGFKSSISQKVAGFDSEISIWSASQGEDDPFDTVRIAVHETVGPGVAVSRVITSTAIVKTDNDYLGLNLSSIPDSSLTYSFIADNLTDGEMPANSSGRPEIILSRATARTLSLKPGDRPMLYFMADGDMLIRRATITGLFDSSMGERDQVTAFCNEALAKSLRDAHAGNAKITVDYIGFDRLDETTSAIKNALQKKYLTGQLAEPLRVENVYATSPMYFNWLDLLNVNVAVVIIIMGLVASFTLISGLIILIIGKVRLIGLLKGLGADNRTVREVFMWLSLKIIAPGLIIGNAAGLSIYFIQTRYHLMPLNPEAYFLTYVPMELSVMTIVTLNICALVAAFAVMLLPTMTISKISPSETMRYE